MASKKISIIWEVFLVVTLLMSLAVASREPLNVQTRMLYVKNEEQLQHNMLSPQYQRAYAPNGFSIPPTYISDVKKEELLQSMALSPDQYHTTDAPSGHNFAMPPTYVN
nr:uncharacterized protein LOC125421593 [Ziziphus jujuba var. spinosa]